MAQAYRDAIASLQATAETLSIADSADQTTADWEHQLHGEAVLKLLRENLLEPLAELQKSSPSFNQRKECVSSGLANLWNSLMKDAEGLEANARSNDEYQ